ncbi:MAG: heme A synthase [Gemmatimonadaceae bacterium]
MKAIRRVGWIALVLVFAQIVLGAIVRITGSGFGCGDNWPRCNGAWVPSFAGGAVIIEVSHRYGAVVVSLATSTLLLITLLRRREPGVAGPGGPLRSALLALGFVVAAGGFGWITVTHSLDPRVIVIHKALAVALLATLAAATIRAGGLGAAQATPGSLSSKTFRSARVAAALAFLVVIMGGLTANLPGANVACQGFPLCSRGSFGGMAHVQLTHRVAAYLLALHLVGLLIATTKRRESALATRLARIAFGVVAVQVVLAALLVEWGLPALLRSLHQATGVLVWLATFIFAYLAHRASMARSASAGRSGSAPA